MTRIRIRVAASLAAVTAALLAMPGGALAAAPTPQPYRTNDGLGFHDVLPAGANGFVSGPQIIQFQANGARPAHSNDQLGMYRDLMYGAPHLNAKQIGLYYKDASFGVKAGQAERTYTPCPDVTVVRDSGFGVPHVYGSTRAATMCGLGYVTAEDRLFFIDVLRHAGRGQLSSFAGGSNKAMDEGVWADTPYTEADLQRQYDLADRIYGSKGASLKADVTAYIGGINRYVAEARLDPSKMPGEYAAIGQLTGPTDWQVTDLIAEAALVGGIFGKGGGGELDSALFLQALKKRFGAARGGRAWADFRNADNADAPTTVFNKRFPYEVPPRRSHGMALPDAGSVVRSNVISSSSGSGGGLPGGLGGLLGGFVPSGTSNALLVSASKSRSGHPLAVMGPQVAYFNPEILMEEDVHGPGIDARGAAFPGVNLYVELGRGRDYSWSATSAGQDVVDTFAVPLCTTNGSKPTISSDHYRFRGQCLPFETLDRTITWTPNAGDQTPPGSETLRTLRTKAGIVTARATVRGVPVAYTKLRTTYMHEADSALGFRDFNDPGKVHDVRSFQRAASEIGFTFNWFYADNKHIGYFNSGWNPVRPPDVNPNFPVFADHMWRGFNAGLLLERRTPFREHPQVIDQRYITSWNNKQAPGFRAADDNFNYGGTYRVETLNRRIERNIRGKRKTTLPELIRAMEDAGTVDLRGSTVLPYALEIIFSGPPPDEATIEAVDKLLAWYLTGAHRRDLNRNGSYEHAEAIKIMDAWWPRLLQAEFGNAIGGDAYALLNKLVSDDPPHGAAAEQHGSAYNGGLYVAARQDLRGIVGLGEKSPFSHSYCGGGRFDRCRKALLSSLKASLGVDPYPGGAACNVGDIQACWDAIHFRTVGGISQPFIPWVNRPTYQQAVEIRHHR